MKLRQKFKKWLYGSCPGLAGSFPYYGTRVYFPKGSKIFEMACDQGVYEIGNTFLLESLVKPNSVYFDIGANIGLMAIPILCRHESCKVVSFEPSPNTLSYLVRTVESSRFSDRWHLVDKAVGREPGELDFFMSSSAMGAFDGFRDTKRVEISQRISVPVTTLDFEWEALDKPPVSVIKIDVEGAELETLKGGLSCIQSEHPFILLEWNATNLEAYNCNPEVLLCLAKELEYYIFAVPDLCPIENSTTLKLQMLKTESFLLAPA